MWLPACLGACALLVGVPLVNNAPCAWWWLPACLGVCVLLVGGWWWLPAFLGACALLVGAGCLLVACLGGWLVVGRFVVCGYLHALELVPWWFVPCWLV